MRSLLFVPGDSDRTIQKSFDSTADALIIDLEDAVAPARKGEARALCDEALRTPRNGKCMIVRINAFDTPYALHDLAAVVRGKPDGVMLPKCLGVDDVRRLDAYLTALEARDGLELGGIKIYPIVTETAPAFLALGDYRQPFLVEGPGHCTACHTPKSFLGDDKSGEYLQGSNLQGWFAPNITNDDSIGVGSWSSDDVVAYLKTGHNRYTAATGPMAEEIEHSTSHMRDDDLDAMAVYLKSLPGSADWPAALKSDDPALVAGQAIYRDQCAACHQIDGKGVPALFPSLAESPGVRARDATSLIRIILRGPRSIATEQEPTGPGMPAFGRQLSDEQVASVVSYIRNAWGRPAPAVTTSDVTRLRGALSLRVD